MKKMIFAALMIAAFAFNASGFTMWQNAKGGAIYWGNPTAYQEGVSSGVWELADPVGNLMMTVTDVGTTGNVVVSGTFTATGGMPTLSVPGAFTWGGVAYKPPDADGTTGQVLTTNGALQTSWTSAGGGGTNYWQRVGSVVSPLNAADSLSIPGGAVTIGTSNTSQGVVNIKGGPSLAAALNMFIAGTPGTAGWTLKPVSATDITLASTNAANQWRFIANELRQGVAAGETMILQSDGNVTLGGGTGRTIALNADTITCSRPTVGLFAGSNQNIGAAGKNTAIRGGLQVDQGAQFNSAVGISGVATFTGNITKIRNVATSFPATQGAAGSRLTNDGAGNLTWGTDAGSNLWTLSGGVLVPTTPTNDVSVPGGDITAGVTGTTRGTLALASGTVNVAPGDLILESSNGTPYHVFINDAGDALRIAAATPTANTDGVLGVAAVPATVPAANITGTLNDSQIDNNLTISGGSVDDSPIGAVTPNSAIVTTLQVQGEASFGGGLFLNNAVTLPQDLGPGLFEGYADIGMGNMAVVFGLDSDARTAIPLILTGAPVYIASEDKVNIFGPVQFDHGAVAMVVVEITADDTTPSVAMGNTFTIPATWTALANITMFDDGVVGQTIRIRGGNANCIVEESASIEMQGLGPWIATPGHTLVLTMYSAGVWTRDSSN